MSLLPPAGTEIATKGDLEALGAGLRGEMAELRAGMADLRSELRGEMADLRTELRTEIANVRIELHDSTAELTKRLMTSIIATMLTTVFVVAALAFGAARLV